MNQEKFRGVTDAPVFRQEYITTRVQECHGDIAYVRNTIINVMKDRFGIEMKKKCKLGNKQVKNENNKKCPICIYFFPICIFLRLGFPNL